MTREDELYAEAKAALELMAWMHHAQRNACADGLRFDGREGATRGVGTAIPAPILSGGDDDSDAA